MFELISWGARYDPECPVPTETIQRMTTDRDAMIAQITAPFEESD